uniref:ESF1-like protein n=1 Tax=Angiostrongylus cantonensis TaxID=6313 RepID=A0A0K0D6B0_ANGCA
LRKRTDSLSNLYELRDSDEDVLGELPTKKSNVCKQMSQNNTTFAMHSEVVAHGSHSNPDTDNGSNESVRLKEEQAELTISDSDNERPFKFDLARGEGNVASSSDDDDSEWEWGNMENDQLEIDLAHLDQPFGGSIRRITIYLSDFGSERLAEEDKYGPKLKLNKPIEEYDALRYSTFSETRLAIRRYQVEQLRYYYAVIECDSVETAIAIYDQCDGYHFESSDLKMDLRFVPEGMAFDVCDSTTVLFLMVVFLSNG